MESNQLGKCATFFLLYVYVAERNCEVIEEEHSGILILFIKPSLSQE